MIGREWSVDEVRALLLKDRIFYESSGGGVTFSGGEPLAQPEFLLACLRACRTEGIHSAIDTTGYSSRDKLLRAAQFADLVLFDIKILESEAHERLLGVPLEPIIRNLSILYESGSSIELRVPIIPGVTDTERNLEELRTLVGGFPRIRKISLLPYHKTGLGKHHQTRRDSAVTDLRPPTEVRMAEVVAALDSIPQEVVIGG